MSTTYQRPGRFPPASTRYGKPAEPVKVTFATPEEAGERDEEGRLLLTAPLAPPPRPPTTVMPLPAVPLPRPSAPAAKPGRLPPVTVSPAVLAKALEDLHAEARRRLRAKPIMPDDIPY